MAIRHRVERARKRPPLRSYIPFTIVMALFVALLAGSVVLVLHMLGGSGGKPPVTPGSALAVTHAVVTSTPLTGGPKSSPTAQSAQSGVGHPATVGTGPSTAVVTPFTLQITPGGPLPTHVPTATATPDLRVTLVVARYLDAAGQPSQAARRFVSPAKRLYAVAMVHTIHVTDVLRFVFERNGVVVPGDDISYTAGTNDPSRPLSAWADYHSGSQPLPPGHYRVLFYRNKRLEAVANFQVG